MKQTNKQTTANQSSAEGEEGRTTPATVAPTQPRKNRPTLTYALCPVERGRSPLARGHGNPLRQSRAPRLRQRDSSARDPSASDEDVWPVTVDRSDSTRTTADGWGWERRGKIFYSSVSTDSMGQAILVRKNIQLDVHCIFKSQRILIVGSSVCRRNCKCC